MKEYIGFIETQIQKKKHLIITGTRGSGKTTLLRKLRERLDTKEQIPGIITWCVPGKNVFMRKVGEEDAVTIGEYDPGLFPENSMKPVAEGFNVYGVSFLEEFIKSDSEWVLIDEIGFLEATCQPFLQKLDELFEQKRVMAVVRKQNLKHINDIVHREDAMVIELDQMCEWGDQNRRNSSLLKRLKQT